MKYVGEVYDDVVWMHTDGFICKTKHAFKNMGTDLGQLKYEGYYEQCEIVNCIEVKGDFVKA